VADGFLSVSLNGTQLIQNVQLNRIAAHTDSEVLMRQQ